MAITTLDRPEQITNFRIFLINNGLLYAYYVALDRIQPTDGLFVCGNLEGQDSYSKKTVLIENESFLLDIRAMLLQNCPFFFIETHPLD